MSVFALIPAAGSGSRISPVSPKQYAPLAGRPMLWHAIRAVCVPPVETVFVVLAPEDKEFAGHDWSQFQGKLEPLYCGGATRRDSVYNGLVSAMAAVDADDWMLVHDAARPCLSKHDFYRLLEECSGDDVGGTLALAVAETVKKASREADAAKPRSAGTEDRSQLWLAQTPQMFRAGLLTQALQRAKGRVTDESSAIEEMGLQPRLVSGSRENLKVTYPEDLAIAEGILARRERA